MEISEVEVIPVKPQGGLIAFVSFVIGNAYYVSSVGVFTKIGGGYRLVFPTKRVGEKNMNIHHPINSRASKIIEDAVLEKVINLFGDL